MACCLPCCNCAMTRAVRCASCSASAPYVHGETACTARAMKERRPVTQGIGVTDVKKIQPQSSQKWQLHRRGAHRITNNDLHDGRTGAQLRPNVQRRSPSDLWFGFVSIDRLPLRIGSKVLDINPPFLSHELPWIVVERPDCDGRRAKLRWYRSVKNASMSA